MQIVTLIFCHVSKFQAPDCSKHQHIGTKTSVLWPSKYDKMRFRPGPAPDPTAGAHDTSTDSLVNWGGVTSPKIPARSTPISETHHCLTISLLRAWICHWKV